MYQMAEVPDDWQICQGGAKAIFLQFACVCGCALSLFLLWHAMSSFAGLCPCFRSRLTRGRRTVCKLRVDFRCSSSEKRPNHPTPPKSALSLCAY
ncbi:uncharacterized protein P884DRAFT_313505, partial [Thermothelomyces heterothallicus CBS 202.75]|uniref:uncharacterized protein n=1 Tax=Thermothelomyces heterothallicus CBS 202.75 TaxID=1149848 RepID=UPI0037449ACD